MGIRHSCLDTPNTQKCGVCCLSGAKLEVLSLAAGREKRDLKALDIEYAISDPFHSPKNCRKTQGRCRKSPTVEDTGKNWIPGIEIIEDSIAGHDSDKDDRFHPMTPPRSSRILESEKNNMTGSHAVPIGGLTGNVALQSVHTPPATEELDACPTQNAVAPIITVLDTRTIPKPTMQGLLLDQKPESMAGKYENEYGSYEIVGPFGIGRAASYHVWQKNKDESVTTGRLFLTSTGAWEGELENASLVFGHISITKTDSGLRSIFRGLNSSEYGDDIHSVKVL